MKERHPKQRPVTTENIMLKRSKPSQLGAALIALAILLAWPSASFGAGLAREVEGNPQQPLELLPLSQLYLNVEVNEFEAVYVETRYYDDFELSVFSDNGCSPYDQTEPRNYTFYRPLESEDTELTSVRIAGNVVPAQILSAKEADGLRETLVHDMDDPAPLRQLGKRMVVVGPVTLSLPSFYPVEVQFTVTQPLGDRGTLKSLNVPVDWHRQPANIVNMNVEAKTTDKLRAIYSPYDPLTVTRNGAYAASAVSIIEQRCTAFDVELLLSTGNEPFHLDLLPYRYDDLDGGYFMALVTGDPEPDDAAVAPRDIVIVLDQSGSMSGQKLYQAQTALMEVLDGLRPEDNFALIRFSNEAVNYAPEILPATAENVFVAKYFLNGIQADGGTNIYAALSEAFEALPNQTDHPRYVVLLTDGEATVGETDTDAILEMAKAQNENNARIFTFGIGDNVNTWLLDQLAMNSVGDALYVQSIQKVEATVEEFFAQIANPVLADPAIDFGDIGVSTLHPSELGDLFFGQTATILGRYDHGGTGVITITGKANGVKQSHAFEISLPEYSTGQGYVPRIWATRHVGALLQDAKLGNSDPALIEEVIAIAERFGVVTEFTYFEVDEEGNTFMKYSPVPVDAVGGIAVATSTSLDGYQKGGTVGAAVDDFVRYTWDRTLPSVNSWFTDTSLDEDANWVDLEFGSMKYFYLAHQASKMGIGEFLAIGRNIRFEFLGQAYRITDPSNCNFQGEGCGVELPSVPADDTGVTVPPIEDKDDKKTPGKEGNGDEGEAGTKHNGFIGINHDLDVQPRFVPETEENEIEGATFSFDAGNNPSYGCSLGGRSGSPIKASGLLLLLLGFGAHTLVRRRQGGSLI